MQPQPVPIPPDLKTDETLTASTIVRRGIAFQFGASDLPVIEALTFRMMMVGAAVGMMAFFCLLSAGLAYASNHLQFAVMQGVASLVLAAVAYHTLGTASAFRKIVEQSGSDIPHLRNALRSLAKSYGVIATVIFGAAVVFMVLMVGAIVLQATGAPPKP